MHRNYFLIIVAAALFCLFLIFYVFWQEIKTPVTQESVIAPAPTPYNSSISGVGLVEPSSDNIAIGAPLQRIVKNVYVASGQKVKKGELLFMLENSDLRADLKSQEAAYNSSQAKLKKLEAYPRQEDLEAAKAALNSAKVELELTKRQYEMVLNLPDPRAISEQEKNTRYLKYQQAKADFQRATADLDKVKAGAWKPDLEIARHEIEEAKTNIDRINAKIAQTYVRSPIDGTVLQLKIHEGELPSLDTSTPLLILGNTDEKYLRVSINQLDIPLFHTDSPAEAFLQGDTKEAFPLEFISLEPYLVHKKIFTHGVSETVDTRVLQVLYRIKKTDPKLFVGQQMDVFIETKDRL